MFNQTLAFSQKNQAKTHLYNQQLLSKIKERLAYYDQKSQVLETQLDLKSPLTIMAKGYLVSYQDGQLIKSVDEIDKNKLMTLRYHDGSIDVKPE